MHKYVKRFVNVGLAVTSSILSAMKQIQTRTCVKFFNVAAYHKPEYRNSMYSVTFSNTGIRYVASIEHLLSSVSNLTLTCVYISLYHTFCYFFLSHSDLNFSALCDIIHLCCKHFNLTVKTNYKYMYIHVPTH